MLLSWLLKLDTTMKPMFSLLLFEICRMCFIVQVIILISCSWYLKFFPYFWVFFFWSYYFGIVELLLWHIILLYAWDLELFVMTSSGLWLFDLEKNKKKKKNLVWAFWCDKVFCQSNIWSKCMPGFVPVFDNDKIFIAWLISRRNWGLLTLVIGGF